MQTGLVESAAHGGIEDGDNLLLPELAREHPGKFLFSSRHLDDLPLVRTAERIRSLKGLEDVSSLFRRERTFLEQPIVLAMSLSGTPALCQVAISALLCGVSLHMTKFGYEPEKPHT